MGASVRILAGMLIFLAGAAEPAGPRERPAAFSIVLDRGHPWRPPFGLDRVGSPITARLRRSGSTVPAMDLFLSARVSGRERSATPVQFAPGQLQSERIALAGDVDEVVLVRRIASQPGSELARAQAGVPELEIDALAVADPRINPVDLGAILPPSDWLLVGASQTVTVDVAAVSHASQARKAELAAWFEATPQQRITHPVILEPDKRLQVRLSGLATPKGADRTVLSVGLTDSARRPLWQKQIRTMLVDEPPRWPSFGASTAKLRYDAPISVRDPATGTFSTLSYDHAWPAELRDVVVSFPSGARFVFWRGSSYIPFWAGRNNTGLCYEWAERLPPMPAGAVDCVEPLMDKELRYGRVEIVQSTPARVHVRWTYQSTDLHYKVWGDAAVEDYWFYPDGFGTRVLSLKHEPKAEYELSELILLTPGNLPPLAVVPRRTVDAICLDGRKHEFLFPGATASEFHTDQPAVYRIRLHGEEPLAAVCFNPYDTGPPPVVFSPFFDEGELVTPAYWGSHWPLARGNATGSKIDDRMYLTPCHNSLMSWASRRPGPLSSSLVPAIDALGRSRLMALECWAWLIGMTDASDGELVQWARSFALPPCLSLTGAQVESEGYVVQRRAMRLRITQPHVTIRVKPAATSVHPVFELSGAPKVLSEIRLNGRPLESQQYAWDGNILWLGVSVDAPATLDLDFAQ